MPIQRGRIELGENINFVNVAVKAVGDRDVNETIICSQWDSRLSSGLGQWVQACSCTSSENNAQNFLREIKQNITSQETVRADIHIFKNLKKNCI